MKNKRWCNLYQATNGEKFNMVDNSSKNVKQAETNQELEILDVNWFQFENENKKLYFYSRRTGNICQVSMYWTQLGESFLLSRRKFYLYIRDSHHFGSNDCKSFKYLPYDWTF